MPIAFACPVCGRAYNVADDLAGRQVLCKGCNARMLVPGSPVVGAPPGGGSTPSERGGDDEERRWQEMVAQVESNSPVLRSPEQVQAESLPPPPPTREDYDQEHGLRRFTGPRKFEILNYPGVAWLDDFLPYILIFVGLALPFFVLAVGTIRFVKNWPEVLGLLLGMLVLYLAVVVPITLGGVMTAGKLMAFPLPEAAYKRMLAIFSLPIAMGIWFTYLDPTRTSTYFGLFVGLLLTFPVLWMLFHLRFVEAIVSYLMSAVFFVISLYVLGLILQATVPVIRDMVEPGQKSSQTQSQTQSPDQLPLGQAPAASTAARPPPSKPQSIDEWRRVAPRSSEREAELAKLYGKPTPMPAPGPEIFQAPPSPTQDFAPPWAGQSELAEPVAIAGWVVTPPRAMQLQLSTLREELAETSAIWTSGQTAMFSFNVKKKARPDQQRPWVTTQQPALSGSDADLLAWKSPADVKFDTGQIAGATWMRYATYDERTARSLVVENGGQRYLIEFDQPSRLEGEPEWIVTYVRDTGESWVRVELRWKAAAAQIESALEAAARTVRSLKEGEQLPGLLSPTTLAALDEDQWKVASRILGAHPRETEAAARKMISSTDAKQRDRGIELMEQYATRESIPDLKAATLQGDSVLGRRALAVWKRLASDEVDSVDEMTMRLAWSLPQGDVETLRQLRQMAPSQDVAKRTKIVDMLAQIVQAQASEQIGTRADAVSALGRWGEQRHVVLLAPFASSDDALLQRNALDGLARIGGADAANAVVAAWSTGHVPDSLRSFFEQTLIQLGTSGEEAMVLMLRHEDLRKRREAIEILGRIGGAKATTALVRLMREDTQFTNDAQAALRMIRERPREQPKR